MPPIPGRPAQPARMNLVNLTGHHVRVFSANGGHVDLEPEQVSARVVQDKCRTGQILVDGVCLNVAESTFGNVEGLPAPKAGVCYVVSRITALAAGREDVVFPDQCIKTRGSDNQTVYNGCTSLCRVK